MLSPTSFELSMTAACGHPQPGKLRYRSAREKNEQMAEVKAMICDTCRAQLRSWMADDHGDEKFSMDFPEMTGTPKMIKWATDLRKARFEKYGSLMLALSKMLDSELAKTAWKALYLMFMVSESKHWIDNRNYPFTDLNLFFEVSNLMKDPGRNKGVVMGSGPFNHFREKAPFVLQRIALFDLAVLPTVDVMPTIYT